MAVPMMMIMILYVGLRMENGWKATKHIMRITGMSMMMAEWECAFFKSMVVRLGSRGLYFCIFLYILLIRVLDYITKIYCY